MKFSPSQALFALTSSLAIVAAIPLADSADVARRTDHLIPRGSLDTRVGSIPELYNIIFNQIPIYSNQFSGIADDDFLKNMLLALWNNDQTYRYIMYDQSQADKVRYSTYGGKNGVNWGHAQVQGLQHTYTIVVVESAWARFCGRRNGLNFGYQPSWAPTKDWHGTNCDGIEVNLTQ